ncbi:MAG: hypothetical protein AAGB93_11915 [Planctomycetota bacterium]
MPEPPPSAPHTPVRRDAWDAWDALSYGWRVGMVAWFVLFVVGVAVDEDPEWMLWPVGLVVFGALQFVAMLPGALAFWIWYRLAGGAALRPVLATLQGCLVGFAALACWTVFVGVPTDRYGGLFLGPTLPSMAVLVGAATFSAGARQLRRERERTVDTGGPAAGCAPAPKTAE